LQKYRFAGSNNNVEMVGDKTKFVDVEINDMNEDIEVNDRQALPAINPAEAFGGDDDNDLDFFNYGEVT
jgi:U3 small nucleolar ribonucleoprotein component